MPQSTTNISHAKGTPHVVNYPPWTGFSIGHSGLASHDVCVFFVSKDQSMPRNVWNASRFYRNKQSKLIQTNESNLSQHDDNVATTILRSVVGLWMKDSYVMSMMKRPRRLCIVFLDKKFCLFVGQAVAWTNHVFWREKNLGVTYGRAKKPASNKKTSDGAIKNLCFLFFQKKEVKKTSFSEDHLFDCYFKPSAFTKE